MDEYAELFIKRKIPLVLATVPELLIENASSQKETRLQVARRVEEAGGEIIAHNGGVLTQEGFSDYSTMYSFFVRTKQIFNYYGFDVNGIILSGGVGQVAGAQETEEWASSFYSYSDLYGVKQEPTEEIIDSVYFHTRSGMSRYNNSLEKIKQEIDVAIQNRTWLVFYFHDSKDINTEILEQVLDYVEMKSAEELEVVTYKEMYEKSAIKASYVKDTKNTYYVSSTGASSVGTSETSPMSYETARSKTYKSGDTILFKRGDIFYGTFHPTMVATDEQPITISAYGEGMMPIISGYKIANSESSWQMHSEGLYKIYLMDCKKFTGITATDNNSNNIGFLEDSNRVKYFNKKSSLSELEEKYDFYCDGYYLYMKTDKNPYTDLGELKLATKNNLMVLASNVKVENIRFLGTGAHGLVAANENTENVEISNNIIEDIGGSYLKGTIRYGNGIEFYGTNASNIVIKDNIIRNVYDVGFTMQGTKGSGKNVVVERNLFVSNSQDSEIWESGSATGIESYEFRNNISINAGRGWGYDARPDKYAAAHILFWQYLLENTNIYFNNNIVYNPKRVYFVEQTNKTDVYFKEKDYIKSDYNTYLLSEDSTIFRDSYKLSETDEFVEGYKKDLNSVFSLIEVDKELVNVASTFDDKEEIERLVALEVGGGVIVSPNPTKGPEPTKEEVTPKVTISPEPTKITEPTKAPALLSITPSPIPTESEKATATPSPTPTESAKATATPSPTLIESEKATATPSPTSTESEKATATPSSIPTESVKVTTIASPTPMEGGEITVTPIPTKIAVGSLSVIPTKSQK